LDGSTLAECVLPHVAAFASAYASSVTLLHAHDLGRSGIDDDRGALFVDPVGWQLGKLQAEAYLEKTADRLGALGVQADREVMDGAAAECVIEYANQHDVDLIVLSSHGQSGLSGWNVSSVVQKIMMRAYRSILIVRAYRLAEGETDRQQYRRVLVPLDGSQRAECAVSVAASLATAQHAPTMRPQLVLGHVVRWPEMPRRTRMTEQDIELANRLVERNRAEISTYLHGLKAQLPVDVTVQVLVGRDVALALHELVDGQGSDLVIMSAHGHSGAHRWPYGSVATSMISYGNSPLLMIQDLGRNDVQLSQAEQMVQEHKGH
jgi:nucleotide-binding universal stress UspA family protein